MNQHLTPEQRATAIATPAHLKRWLRESGRPFVIFESNDLIDCLRWPEGPLALIDMVYAYQQYRARRDSALTDTAKDPVDGSTVYFHKKQTEKLELEELDRLARYVCALAHDAAQERGVTWSLNDPAL